MYYTMCDVKNIMILNVIGLFVFIRKIRSRSSRGKYYK